MRHSKYRSVVVPLKGRPIAGGWDPSLPVTAFLINGAWGVGTGLILKALSGRFGGPRDAMA
jgi:ATP-dependent Clp protease ATP-binding subunit ClpA